MLCFVYSIVSIVNKSIFCTSLFFMAFLLHSVQTLIAAEPPIEKLVKSNVLDAVITDNEVVSNASLIETPSNEYKKLKTYSFYSLVKIRASVDLTRRVLTDWVRIGGLIPFVDEIKLDPKTQLLSIRGGIMGYVLVSVLKFNSNKNKDVIFEVVSGHFTGLKGTILFEAHNKPDSPQAAYTLVHFSGGLEGETWPPKMVMEKGAEIVFSYAAKKMRSEVAAIKNDFENSKQKFLDNEGNEFPQPKGHL
jgi:hypothetical protein